MRVRHLIKSNVQQHNPPTLTMDWLLRRPQVCTTDVPLRPRLSLLVLLRRPGHHRRKQRMSRIQHHYQPTLSIDRMVRRFIVAVHATTSSSQTVCFHYAQHAKASRPTTRSTQSAVPITKRVSNRSEAVSAKQRLILHQILYTDETRLRGVVSITRILSTLDSLQERRQTPPPLPMDRLLRRH